MLPLDWDWSGQWVAVVLAAAMVHCWGRPLDMSFDVAGELLRRGGRGMGIYGDLWQRTVAYGDQRGPKADYGSLWGRMRTYG